MAGPTALARLRAHGIEGLAGFGVGGGLGGGGAALAEAGPREWMDEDGKVRSRRKTKEERKASLKKVLLATLAGGSVGAGASLGAGAVRRRGISAREASSAKDVVEPYLEGLKPIVDETLTESGNAAGAMVRARLAGQSGRASFTPSKARIKALERNHEAAQARSMRVLDEKLSLTHDLKNRELEAARQARLGAPWGGRTRQKARTNAAPTGAGSGNNWTPHTKNTHAGRVGEKVTRMRERMNLPPLRSPTDPTGEGFFRAYLDALEKKSEVSLEAFLREVGSILEIT